jgi:hypothetical protein
MATQGGFGLTVNITIGETLTAIATILDGEIPRFKRYLAEFTAHDSTSGYDEYISTGRRGLDKFKLTLGWDAVEETHEAIVAAFDSEDPVEMSVEDPAGIETITFDAFIEEIGRIAKQKEGYVAEVVIQPTGAPTITIAT